MVWRPRIFINLRRLSSLLIFTFGVFRIFNNQSSHLLYSHLWLHPNLHSSHLKTQIFRPSNKRTVTPPSNHSVCISYLVLLCPFCVIGNCPPNISERITSIASCHQYLIGFVCAWREVWTEAYLVSRFISSIYFLHARWLVDCKCFITVWSC